MNPRIKFSSFMLAGGLALVILGVVDNILARDFIANAKRATATVVQSENNRDILTFPKGTRKGFCIVIASYPVGSKRNIFFYGKDDGSYADMCKLELPSPNDFLDCAACGAVLLTLGAALYWSVRRRGSSP